MKDGVGIVNCARGGVVIESSFSKTDSGKVLFAGLDVLNEPKPEMTILMHPKVSLTPHIGAATGEAKIELEQNLLHKLSVY
jgi:D-3-phosphoglycerate dehydrogenase